MSENLRKKLKAAIGALNDNRLRWLISREKDVLASGKVDRASFKSILDGILKDEIDRWLILKELEGRGPLTIKELSRATGLAESAIVNHMIALRWLRRISTAGKKDDLYLYALSGK